MHHHTPGYIDALEAERARRTPAFDPAAVPDIVRRFGARVHAVARRHRLGSHDIEDVVQTTWVRLLEHDDGIRDARAIGSWLETTARHESLRVLRKSGRELPTDRELLADEPTDPVDEERLAARERQVAITGAVAGLSGRQRDVVALLLADPAPSYAEIARALDMPIGSIGPTRARILERLSASPQVAAVRTPL